MQHRRVDVVIVGGGVSGLTAAWRLQQEGVAVAVFEARSRVGGRLVRIASVEGVGYDGGGQFLAPSQDRVMALTSELGLETSPTTVDGDFVRITDGQRFTSRDAPFGDAALAAEFAQAWARLDEMAVDLASAGWRDHPSSGDWDSQTLRT